MVTALIKQMNKLSDILNGSLIPGSRPLASIAREVRSRY